MSKELVPYQRYATESAREITRLRSDRQWMRNVTAAVAWPFLIIGVAVLILEIFVIDEPVLRALVLLIPAAAALIGFATTVGQWYPQTFPGMFKNQQFVCPHCDVAVPVTGRWRCGWCSTEHDGRVRLVFDSCAHSACREVPNGVRCTRCGEDVVLQVASYAQHSQQRGDRVAGVAQFIGGATRAKQAEAPPSGMGSTWRQ